MNYVIFCCLKMYKVPINYKFLISIFVNCINYFNKLLLKWFLILYHVINKIGTNINMI